MFLTNTVKLAVWQIGAIVVGSAGAVFGVEEVIRRKQANKAREELDTLEKRIVSLGESQRALEEKQEEFSAENLNKLITGLSETVIKVAPVATEALKTTIPVVIGAMAEIDLASKQAVKEAQKKVSKVEKKTSKLSKEEDDKKQVSLKSVAS